jgi:hypothetical protein
MPAVRYARLLSAMAGRSRMLPMPLTSVALVLLGRGLRFLLIVSGWFLPADFAAQPRSNFLNNFLHEDLSDVNTNCAEELGDSTLMRFACSRYEVFR